MFNALKYTEELEKAGFSRGQAEASVRILIDVMNENFATKADIKDVRTEIKELDLKLDNSVQRLETKIESTAKELDYKLTVKLGAMLAFSVGLMATLVKLLETSH